MRITRAWCASVCRACVGAGAALLLSAGLIYGQNTITTFVGRAWSFTGNGGAATLAPVGPVAGLATDSGGNLYVADPGNNLVFRITPAGTLTIVAGNGAAGYSGDGFQATTACISGPMGVAVDGSGNIFIADYSNNRVRKVDTSGFITTVAGTGTRGYSGDNGQATAAQICSPEAVAVDISGNLYIADSDNYRVRKARAALSPPWRAMGRMASRETTGRPPPLN